MAIGGPQYINKYVIFVLLKFHGGRVTRDTNVLKGSWW